MLGDFITKILVLLLGYAYPAFECYKSVEKKKPEIQELRHWCKYWMLVGLLTVLQRIGDIFVSWLPLYGEMKVAMFLYLWYPNTQGTSRVYEMLLRPYVSRYEVDIDRSIAEFRIRGGDILVRFWHCSFQWIQTTIPQVLEFLQQQFAVNQQRHSSKSIHRSQKLVSWMKNLLLSESKPILSITEQQPTEDKTEKPNRNHIYVSPFAISERSDHGREGTTTTITPSSPPQHGDFSSVKLKPKAHEER